MDFSIIENHRRDVNPPLSPPTRAKIDLPAEGHAGHAGERNAMKKDLRMNAKSPDPDDLANDAVPEGNQDERDDRSHRRAPQDRSAPHIPPLEKGKIRGED
jgi:hypothetical protein